jgi:ribonuclease P protein component
MNRYGFVTSRKVGNAVARNRVRRRLRVIARDFDAQLQPGHLIVTVARHSAARASFTALREQWQRLARKGGLLIAGASKTEGRLP